MSFVPEPRFMRRALRLSRHGLGHVSPNPPVGAVVVRDGVVVGEGYHRSFGGPHAEVDALSATGDAAGADVYVTLEPCGHHGKTPPCSEALIAAGVARVVYAAPDPHPETAGSGPDRLHRAGIEVISGIEEAAVRETLAPYYSLVLRRRPLVTAKWAMTWDGRIATASGDAAWISSEETRARTRLERGLVDAVLVGRGTALADDPRLTCDAPPRRDPLRVVLDSRLSLPLTSQLVRIPAPLLVVCSDRFADSDEGAERRRALEAEGVEVKPLPTSGMGIELDPLLAELASRGVAHLLVEGGGDVHGAFQDQGLIDRVQVVLGAKVCGGAEAPGPVAGAGVERMARAAEIPRFRLRRSGVDLLLEGCLTPAGRGEWTPGIGGC